MKLPRKLSFKKPIFTKDVRVILPLAAVIVVAVSAFSIFSSNINKPSAEELKAHKDQLQIQVDTPDGAPRPGRDPANKQQSTLAMAASSPVGLSNRSDQPASNVQGDQNTKYSPSSNDPKKTGINSSGCFYNYGKPGECVQAHIAENGKLTCSIIHSRTNFHNGLQINGEDRFNLDSNGDGLACGPGDA